MIQFKRGSTKSWQKAKPLAAGQPGYDKDRKKLKIGNGKDTWDSLPDASGLFMDEILDSEENAKKKVSNKNTITGFIASLLKKEDRPIITYGTEVPDQNTVGQLYLQYYDTEPEVDYIVSTGVDGIWSYRVWKSGIAECWGTLPLTTSIQNAVGSGVLYNNDSTMKKIDYPFTFSAAPTEIVSLSCAKNRTAWIANQAQNTTKTTGLYTLLSHDKQTSATFNIMLSVKGYINK